MKGGFTPRGRPPFRRNMAREDPATTTLKESNRRLREALTQCRQLLKKTEELLQRAHRIGGGPTGRRSI
jgi:hypothetical protein